MRAFGRFLALAVLLAVVTTVAAQTRPPQPQKHAVVIGVGKYTDPQIPPLPYAADDARAMYRFLTDPKGGGFAPQNVEMLLDNQATRGRVLSALTSRLRKRAFKGDTIFIFYAGHGAPELDERESDGRAKFLMPYDAIGDDLAASGIRLNSIGEIFDRVTADAIVLVLDTCYSGAGGGRGFSMIPGGTRSGPLSSDFLDRLAQGEGRAILSAAGPNEVALELPELKHGLFTYFLLEALQGAADSTNKGYITVHDVYQYVQSRVVRRSAQAGARQNPHLTMVQRRDEIILVGHKKAMVVTPPTRSNAPSAQPPLKAGSLVVNSSQDGAEMFLDNQSIGVVRNGALFFNIVAAGKYRLAAKKPGFKEWSREIEISADLRNTQFVALEPVGSIAQPAPAPVPSPQIAALGTPPGTAAPSAPAGTTASRLPPPAAAPTAPEYAKSEGADARRAAEQEADARRRVEAAAAKAKADEARRAAEQEARRRTQAAEAEHKRQAEAERRTNERIAAISPAPRPASPPARSERAGAVIGIGNYDHGRLPKLRFAERDARSMYDVLLRGGVLRDNLELLTDGTAPKPTFSSIKRALGVFTRRTGTDDTIILYYSGHGAVEADATGVEGDGFSKYLVPRDADPEALFVTGLDMEEFQAVFSKSPARTIVLLLDTAFGPGGKRSVVRQGLRDAKLSDDYLDRVTRGRGRVIITAGGANEVAAELPESGRGLFTHYLVKALEGEADTDRNGVVTLNELYRYVESRVADHARRLGIQQRPTMKGTADRDTVLVELKRP